MELRCLTLCSTDVSKATHWRIGATGSGASPCGLAPLSLLRVPLRRAPGALRYVPTACASIETAHVRRSHVACGGMGMIACHGDPGSRRARHSRGDLCRVPGLARRLAQDMVASVVLAGRGNLGRLPSD